jgi:hypothetical protein
MITSLATRMVRWCEGGVNQGLLPMTISEEESNLFCNSFREYTTNNTVIKKRKGLILKNTSKINYT